VVTGLEFWPPCDNVPPQLGVWSAADTALRLTPCTNAKAPMEDFLATVLPRPADTCSSAVAATCGALSITSPVARKPLGTLFG